MKELLEIIPIADDVIALEPEELAGVLILAIKSRIEKEPQGMVNFGNLVGEIQRDSPSGRANYPREKWSLVETALVEAWNWLEVQGLLIPASSINGQNGWRVLSRRAKQFSNANDVLKFSVGRRFPKEILHPVTCHA